MTFNAEWEKYRNSGEYPIPDLHFYRQLFEAGQAAGYNEGQDSVMLLEHPDDEPILGLPTNPHGKPADACQRKGCGRSLDEHAFGMFCP